MLNDKNHETKLRIAWKQYKDNGDERSREYIITSYIPLVKRIAHDVMKKKPSNFEHSDLFQAGMIGLMHALERFDPDNGASFSTFASLRIQGSMYDEINSMDWTPRSVREKIKLVIKAIEAHSKQHNSAPTLEELVSIIETSFGKELTEEQVREAINQSHKTYIHAMDSSQTLEQEENRSGVVTLHTNNDVVEDVVENKLLNEKISAILNENCTPFERLVFYSVHNEGKPMRHIARELDIPVARVSEARHKVDALLRKELVDQGVFPERLQ